jgi:hypothetical protein
VKAKQAFFVMLCCLPLVVAAQAPDVIPLASEPHHHLALHNEYVNVYRTIPFCCTGMMPMRSAS